MDECTVDGVKYEAMDSEDGTCKGCVGLSDANLCHKLDYCMTEDGTGPHVVWIKKEKQ